MPHIVIANTTRQSNLHQAPRCSVCPWQMSSVWTMVRITTVTTTSTAQYNLVRVITIVSLGALLDTTYRGPTTCHIIDQQPQTAHTLRAIVGSSASCASQRSKASRACSFQSVRNIVRTIKNDCRAKKKNAMVMSNDCLGNLRYLCENPTDESNPNSSNLKMHSKRKCCCKRKPNHMVANEVQERPNLYRGERSTCCKVTPNMNIACYTFCRPHPRRIPEHTPCVPSSICAASQSKITRTRRNALKSNK